VNDICQFEPVPGCCHEDVDCGDGVFCNGQEVCTNHECGPGSAPDCLDEHDCTSDRCDGDSDRCVHTPDDGLCDLDEVCSPTDGCIVDGECDDDGYEDNDVLEQATRIEPSNSYILQLCPGDPDWMVFAVHREQTSVIELTSVGQITTIEADVVDAFGRQVGEKMNPMEGILIFIIDDPESDQDLFLHIPGSVSLPIRCAVYFEVS
jgi:hypothetical protein